MKIGVLALQGDFAEHIAVLKRLKVEAPAQRRPDNRAGLRGSALAVPGWGRGTGSKEPYHAIFIRAPIIQSVSGEARVLATTADKRIVAGQQGHLLATSFHPALTRGDRFH